MKAEFDKNGALIISARNRTEEYALEAWWNENIHPCTRNFKEGKSVNFGIDVKIPIKDFWLTKLKWRIYLFFTR